MICCHENKRAVVRLPPKVRLLVGGGKFSFLLREDHEERTTSWEMNQQRSRQTSQTFQCHKKQNATMVGTRNTKRKAIPVVKQNNVKQLRELSSIDHDHDEEQQKVVASTSVTTQTFGVTPTKGDGD